MAEITITITIGSKGKQTAEARTDGGEGREAGPPSVAITTAGGELPAPPAFQLAEGESEEALPPAPGTNLTDEGVAGDLPPPPAYPETAATGADLPPPETVVEGAGTAGEAAGEMPPPPPLEMAGGPAAVSGFEEEDLPPPPDPDEGTGTEGDIPPVPAA